MPSRFGESFEIKKENRMNVLRESSDLPSYFSSSLEIRNLLREAAREQGWPEMPTEIGSVEAVLESAKKVVTERWGEKIRPMLAKKAALWADELEGKAGMDDKIAVLRDPDALEEKLMIHQFGLLESIRPILPHAWKELILIASERQMAAVVVAQHWFKNLDEKEKDRFALQVGLKKPAELEIILDAASLFGKYIDQAYVKQIELADAPGGKETSPLAEQAEIMQWPENKKKGVKFFYDVPAAVDSSEINVKSYTEVFPFEWERLVKGMEHLADKIEKMQQDNKIGNEYQHLPEYVRNMAAVYNSKNIDPESLHQQWNKLMRDFRTLALEGCPIMFVPQQNPSVADEANKVDVEIRLGFKSRESQELEKRLEEFRNIGASFIQAIRPHLSKDWEIPPVIVNYQPFAYGPNTYWATRGEADEEKIVTHTNAVLDVVRVAALPAFEKVFVKNFDEDLFNQATLLDTSLHEIGHVIGSKKDDAILKRIGGPGKAKITEELKADAMGQKMMVEHMKRGKGDINYEMQFYARLADACDYLKNKSSEKGTSGEPYYYSGVAVLSRLFEHELLEQDGDKYRVRDWKKGIEVVAEIADEILELYTTGTPEKIEAYIADIRDAGEKTEVVELIRKLKS